MYIETNHDEESSWSVFSILMAILSDPSHFLVSNLIV